MRRTYAASSLVSIEDEDAASVLRRLRGGFRDIRLIKSLAYRWRCPVPGPLRGGFLARLLSGLRLQRQKPTG